MKFDKQYFDGGIDRRETECAKWDGEAIVAHNSLPMQVADMDFPTVPAVAEAPFTAVPAVAAMAAVHYLNLNR